MNKYVKNNIASKWEDLGIELLNEEQRFMLNNIRQNNHNVQDCCTAMFKYWLEVNPCANWNKLIEALDVINQNCLAKKIKRKIFEGIVVT